MSEILYLYGFVPTGTGPPPVTVQGVAGAPVRLIDLGAVSAAVADVPAGMYAPERVEALLEDLGWVGEQGLAHERVVTWFSDHGEILPARLLSLHTGEGSLRRAVADRTQDIAGQLRAFAGRREWNLKVAYDAAELERHAGELSDELRRADEEIAAAAPGRRYLLERRRSELAKREVSNVARNVAQQILDELSTHAQSTRVLPLAATDTGGSVVLNAALLVAATESAALRETAARVYERATGLGMIVVFSGPWAPYRFMESHGEA